MISCLLDIVDSITAVHQIEESRAGLILREWQITMLRDPLALAILRQQALKLEIDLQAFQTLPCWIDSMAMMSRRVS